MVPLLFETPGFLQLVQRTLLVDCSEENQISRVIKRNGMNEEQIRTIIQHQMTRQARRRLKRYLHTGQ
jgi:dephospho-CoA kinase